MAKKPYKYRLNLGFKSTTGGEDTYGHDMKFFGDTTGKYIHWDASADTLYVVGTLDLTGTFNSGNLALIDNETITMGTGSDINFKFDGTNLLWSKTVAAGNALKIDADTVDTTSDVFALDVGVNSASVSAAKINLDVGTALSAGEIARGIYIDANGKAANADTSGLYGVDVLLTATSTDRADIIGYKALVDGTMNTADTIKGILVDLDATLSTNTVYGLHIDGSGLTHTNSTLYGIYNDVSATVSAGTSVAEFIKLSAAATGISIDGGTIDSTAGNAITINWDVNSSSSNMINATIDVGTALSAAEIVKGIYFDINELAANANTSEMYGVDLLMTGISTAASDLVGYKVTFDGTKDQGDSTKGVLVDGNSTINNGSETLYGLHADFSGTTHTDGTLYGTYVAIPTAASGSGYGHYILCNDNTTGIYINSGSTDRTAGNVIEIDLDVNDASVSMIKGFMDWGTASTTAKTVRGLFLDFDDLTGGTNGSALIGCHMLMSGVTGGNSDLQGYKVEFDGTRDQGDSSKGIFIDGNQTINNGSETLYGTHIAFDGLTHTNGTVYGNYIDVSATVSAGASYGSYYKLAAEAIGIYIDAGTNDQTTGAAIQIDYDVNSASVNCIDLDIDVGTALSSAEAVTGITLNIDGNAGDASDSSMTGLFITSANTTAGVNRAINISGTFDRSLEIESTSGRAEIDVEIDNRYRWEYFEDFNMPTINENDFGVILNNDGGGGADPSIASVAENGILTCNTTGGGGANGSQIVIALPTKASKGGLVFETKLHINTAITGCRVIAGFTDNPAWEVGATIGGGDAITTTFSDGCAFVYDDGAVTKEWFAIGVAGDTDATGNATTGTAPVADTDQTLRIEISADGSTGYFYINDALVKTLTANTVTAGTTIYATVLIQESAAAAKTIDVDYILVGHNR